MVLKEGDIIFISSVDEDSDINDEIKNLCIGYDGMHFNHVGIYVGNDKMVEAAYKGVRKTDIIEFLETAGENILVGRIEDQTLARRSALLSLDYVGLPYNHTYIECEEAFYCSQLIHHVYNIANEGQFFEKHRLSYKDTKMREISRYWLDYYNNLGMDVPEGEPGSHPANLSLDERIVSRFFLEKEKHIKW